MSSRLSIGKTSHLEAGVNTNITERMFQGRPFVMVPSKPVRDKQTDQKASLQQAHKYGHSLSNARVQNITNTTKKTTVVQQQKGDKEKIKKQGVDASDMTGGHTGFGGAVADSGIAAGTGGIFGLPGALNDANDAHKGFKEGNKLKAGTSGAKFLAGGAGTGATIAGGFAESVSAAATGAIANVGNIVTGGIDASMGTKNALEAKKSRREVKDVSRSAAEKILPQGANSKPRTTQELRDVQKSGYGSSKALEGQIDQKKIEVNTAKSKIDLMTPNQEPNNSAKDGFRLLRQDRKDLKKQQKQSAKDKSDLKNQKSDLGKSLDTLDVGLYAADTLDKTKKREIVNATGGGIKTVGGAVTFAEPISGSVLGAVGSSTKSFRALAHKTKQTGRNKKYPGFNQNKTSEIKRAERQDIANKMARNRGSEDMQKIFSKLPSVNQEQTDRFKDQQSSNRMSKEEIQKVIKRRNY
ncbi:hypothetical protein [Calothrix sp. CCY 0018]|uniref:hypothetical protein n=1 Tax=Calothrix sp. CCY 0018 TaxID=3103864 RepID=UPI0039C7363A